MMNDSSAMEALEQANDWLSKRLQLTEEQVREGEDVNITLTDENRQLKQAKATLTTKLQDLTEELDHLRSSVQEYNYEKQSLLNNISSLEQEHLQYKQEEQNARELADELKYEMGKAQDVIASNTNDMENMKEYISELELRNSHLQQKLVEQETDSFKVVEEKEELIVHLQKTVNDMESSQSMAMFSNEMSERADSFGLEDNNEVCNSSPASEVVSVKYLQQKMEDKDSTIKELEMRLESMQVANEIYQEELEGLQTRLEQANSQLVHSNPGKEVPSDDDSEMFEVVNDLLARCKKVHQEDIPTAARNTSLTSISTQVDLDLHLVTTASQTDVLSINNFSTQCERRQLACRDNSTQHLLLTQDKSTEYMAAREQLIQSDVHTAAVQTDMLPFIDTDTQTDEAWLKERDVNCEVENIVVPRQCDAVVECQLLTSSFTSNSFHQFTQTSTPVDSNDHRQASCPACLCATLSTNTVGVQTEGRQLPEDSLPVVLSDLRKSLKHTTAVIEELEATTSGVFTAVCEDTLAARTSMSVSSYLNTEAGRDCELKHRGCEQKRDLTSTHSVSGSSTTCSYVDEEESCTYCARGGGRLLNQVASVAVVCILIILLAAFFTMIGFGSYLTNLQRIGARRGLPPH